MKLLSLQAQKAGPIGSFGIVAVTILAGLLTALVVTVVNTATTSNKDMGWGAALFAALILGMYLAQRLASKRIIATFEDTSADLRQRFAAQVRAAPLRAIETLGARLARTVGDLSFLATTLESWVSGVRNLAFLVCTTLSVMLISSSALILWCVTLGMIGLHLWSRLRLIRAKFKHLGDQSAALGVKVEQLIDGFVQAKLDGRIAASLADEIEEATKALYEQQNAVEDIKTRAFVGSFAMMFLIGSCTAAFVPVATAYFTPNEAYQMVMFFELAWAPLFGLLIAAPEMARSAAATQSIVHVLDELPQEPEPVADCCDLRDFERLELRQIEFAYSDAEKHRGFDVGPLDLCIQRGDLVLVTGGNGSGKTTLLKTLIGLYRPSRGELAIDGQILAERQLATWRSRFTTIMSHQHLFDRLYGLPDIQPERVTSLLERLGLAGVTDYQNGCFTNLTLSTGQKMRLAMVVALLEERPVCVFDEWTANQDPETTRWYYDTLLPELRAAGTTVIAVSHDQRFFDRGDHLVVMERGQIVRHQRNDLSPTTPARTTITPDSAPDQRSDSNQP